MKKKKGKRKKCDNQNWVCYITYKYVGSPKVKKLKAKR